jgi:hypothetical protein
VFLGYSSRHKGVKCLEVKTGRVYISRDIVFDETVFPFKSLHPNAGALLCKEIMLLPKPLQPTSIFDHGGVNSIDQRANPANTIASASVQNFAEDNLEQNGENPEQIGVEAGAGSKVDPPPTPGRHFAGSPCRYTPGSMTSGGPGRMHTGSSGSSASGRFDQLEGDTSWVSTFVSQENDALSAGQGDSSALPGSVVSASTSSGSGADSSLSTAKNAGSSAAQNAADTRTVPR